MDSEKHASSDISAIKTSDGDFAPVGFIDIVGQQPTFMDNIATPLVMPVGGIAICLQGSCEVVLDEKRFHIAKNDMFIVFPNSILQAIANRSDDFHTEIISINQSMIYNFRTINISSATSLFLYIKDNPCISLTNEQVEDILQYSRILNKYDRMDDMPFHKHIIEHSVMSLSYIVASIYARHAPIKQMPLTRQNTILHKFLSTLATDFTRSREVAYYADKLCITPKYLTIVVRNTSGMRATEWISRIVINNAKALLTGTQMTVQQISNKLNFPNPSFFGQYFLRHVGKTPKEYRRDSINML